MHVRVVYLNSAGQIVGYLSRNWLIARKAENAALISVSVLGMGGHVAKARSLLAGPHPLDHLGPITVSVEDVEED